MKIVTDWKFAPFDVLTFSEPGLVSRAIKAATVPPWYWFRAHWRTCSHIGICVSFFAGTPPAHVVKLIESTTMLSEPCELLGRRIDGVQAHDPARRMRMSAGPVFVARLAPGWKATERQCVELRQLAKEFLGQKYDYFAAVRSITPFPELADDDRVFCDNLVATLLMSSAIRARYPLSNTKSVTPAQVIKRLVETGVYERPARLK